MAQVDTMKEMQGWSDVSVSQFRDLGVFGEQLLLSIRYGDWIAVNDTHQARNWARYWRPEIQAYIHSYRAVTGVDLMVEHKNRGDRDLQPSVHHARRIGRRNDLPSPAAAHQNNGDPLKSEYRY